MRSSLPRKLAPVIAPVDDIAGAGTAAFPTLIPLPTYLDGVINLEQLKSPAGYTAAATVNPYVL